MTIQERINQAVERIDVALHKSRTLPIREIRETMAWVFDAAITMIADKAHHDAQMILHGLIRDGYTPELADAWIRECVELRQFDELDRKKQEGEKVLAQLVSAEKYEDLLQLLAERAGNTEPEEDEASDEDLQSLMKDYPTTFISVDADGSEHPVARIDPGIDDLQADDGT